MFNFAHSPPSGGKEALPPEAPRGSLVPNLSEMARRVLARPFLIGSVAVGTLLLAILGLPHLTPVYTAMAQVLIDPSDLKVVENGLQSNIPQADSGVSIAESQVRVVASDSVLSRVVDKLDLASDREFAQPAAPADSLVGTLKRILGFTTAGDVPDDPKLRAVDVLRRNLTVRRPERTFVLEVMVRSQRADKAARIVNTITEVYFAEEAAARASSAGRASDALASRLSELRGALQVAEDRLARYREQNGLVATNGRLLVDQRLGDLNSQLGAASIRTAEARARAEQARQIRLVNGSTALPELLQSTELRALRQQHADLGRLVAETSTRLGPRHPGVVEQMAQLRELERVMAREKTRIIDSTVKELERAVAAETAIRREIDRLKAETTANDRSLIGQRDLERDVETQRAIYESYLRRARETGQQERLDTTNMRVISAATAPMGRSWPPSPKVALPAAFLLGLLLGCAVAILRPRGATAARGPVVLSVAPQPLRA